MEYMTPRLLNKSTSWFLTFLLALSFFSVLAPSVHAANCLINADEVFCSHCGVGNRCLTDNRERGTCRVVPEGTADRIVNSEITIRAGNMICTNDGTTPAMLPTELITDKDKDKKAAPPVEPRFTVNIPTVNLTSIQTNAGSVDVPWLADYLTGVYRYAVFFASILAAVILIIGGVQWLTAAGDSGRVGAAQKKIINSVVGLVLVLGSYLVLSTINPNLVALKPLRIKTVPPEPAVFALQTATVSTADNSSNDTSYPIAGGSGTYAARYFPAGQCPVTLTETDSGINSERNKQFFQLIFPRLTGSVQEKFAQAYEAAWLCGLNLGSCGRTISDLATLAKEGPTAGCLNDLEQQVAASNGGRVGCMDRYTHRTFAATGYREYNTLRLSIRDFIDRLQARDPNYPNSLSDNLQPGDIVIYYNANSDATGGHRVYVASVNENGMAQLLNGSIGRPIYTSDRCFSTRCGNFAPIGLIHRLQ
jgi:hypothetical protein